MTHLALTGLHTEPSQAWGGIRLVPLIREKPIEDLRLDARLSDARLSDARFCDTRLGLVEVDTRTTYVSYIPHAYVGSWDGDGLPAAAYGTQLLKPAERDTRPRRMLLEFHRRLARRVDKNRLRFLPMHLALEGYLALNFGGPEILWEEWSRRAIRQGLSPRAEQAYTGVSVRGLAEALRVFEIVPNQCGLLVYAAEALAAAFVVSHPADYRALHPTLVQDLYGELIYHYAMLNVAVPDFRARIEESTVRSLADLRVHARRQHDEWAAFHDSVMARGLLSEDYTFQHIYQVGRYRLSRFLPSFERQRENHIGELITGDAGELAYLKTFRLSASQIRRGHLLTRLAANGWNLSDTAAGLGVTQQELLRRMETAGFEHLLRRDVRDRYR